MSEPNYEDLYFDPEKLKDENEKLKELLTESLEVISENSRLSEAIGRERVLGRNKALIKRIKEALK